MIKAPAQLVTVSTTVFAGLLFLFTSVPALASPPASASSTCGNLTGCDKKLCEIQRQLTISQEIGNKYKSNGLKIALAEAKEHCTDKKLRKDLVEKIAEAKKSITEYEADLKEAKEYGKADKVRKYQEKIENEQSDIKSLENEISILDGGSGS